MLQCRQDLHDEGSFTRSTGTCQERYFMIWENIGNEVSGWHGTLYHSPERKSN